MAIGPTHAGGIAPNRTSRAQTRVPGLDQQKLARYRSALRAHYETLSRPAHTNLSAFCVNGDAEGYYLLSIKALRAGQTVILFRNLANAPCTASEYERLSTAEQDRYASYISQTSAHQFLAGRVLIKQLFSKWLGCPPDEVSTSTQQHENPRLILNNSGSASTLPFFNVAHSSNWVVLAVRAKCQIGVDIEVNEDIDTDCEYSLHQFFNEFEIKYLQAPTQHSTRKKRFLKLWRLKEAVMKATGKGFALDPTSFSVIDNIGRQIHLVSAEGQQWRLAETNLAPTLQAAYAWQVV